jgi:hypothetical protein
MDFEPFDLFLECKDVHGAEMAGPRFLVLRVDPAFIDTARRRAAFVQAENSVRHIEFIKPLEWGGVSLSPDALPPLPPEDYPALHDRLSCEYAVGQHTISAQGFSPDSMGLHMTDTCQVRIETLAKLAVARLGSGADDFPKLRWFGGCVLAANNEKVFDAFASDVVRTHPEIQAAETAASMARRIAVSTATLPASDAAPARRRRINV